MFKHSFIITPENINDNSQLSFFTQKIVDDLKRFYFFKFLVITLQNIYLSFAERGVTISLRGENVALYTRKTKEQYLL